MSGKKASTKNLILNSSSKLINKNIDQKKDVNAWRLKQVANYISRKHNEYYPKKKQAFRIKDKKKV